MAGSENETLVFDVEDLEIGELEELEEICGKPAGTVFKEFQSQDFSAIALRALVWILKRRTQPGLTFEEAKKLKVGLLAQGSTPQRPTMAAVE